MVLLKSFVRAFQLLVGIALVLLVLNIFLGVDIFFGPLFSYPGFILSVFFVFFCMIFVYY